METGTHPEIVGKLFPCLVSSGTVKWIPRGLSVGPNTSKRNAPPIILCSPTSVGELLEMVYRHSQAVARALSR